MSRGAIDWLRGRVDFKFNSTDRFFQLYAVFG